MKTVSFDSATAMADQAAIAPFPNSTKIHVTGSRPDVRVPMRAIAQAETSASFGGEPNPPLTVYDTSGPYTDPAIAIGHPRRAAGRRACRGSSNGAIRSSWPAPVPTTAWRGCRTPAWTPCVSG